MARNLPTFSELRTETRRYLNDLNGGIWTNAELNRNLNRAILQVWIDTEWEGRESTFEGIEDNAWYELPSDCLIPKVFIATDWNQEKIFPADIFSLERYDKGWEESSSSIPSRAFLFSWDLVYLWPPVEPNNATQTVTLQYVPVPAAVTSDASTTLGAASASPPLYVANLIPLKAASLSWLREDWQKYLMFDQQYEQALLDAQTKLRNTSSFHTSKLRPAKRFGKAHGAVRFKLRF